MATNIIAAENATSLRSARTNYILELLLIDDTDIDKEFRELLRVGLAELNGIKNSSIYY